MISRWVLRGALLGLGAAVPLVGCSGADEAEPTAPDSGGSAGTGGSSAAGMSADAGASSGEAGAGGAGEPATVRCTTDAQCEALDFVCDTVRETCAQCIVDAQCPGTERCRGYACEPTVWCKANDDCPASDLFCVEDTGQCEECQHDADCAPGAVCSYYQCVSQGVCSDSFDCPVDQVCDSTDHRCYQCVTNGDCGADGVCVGHTCRASCASDKDCRAAEQLCDLELGGCVDCLTSEQCPDTHFCSAGSCLLDTCEPGEYICDGNDLRVCLTDGSGTIEGFTCEPKAGCSYKVIQGIGIAGCNNSICIAGTLACDGDLLGQCDVDGREWLLAADCSETDQICDDGACKTQLCTPNEFGCVDGDRYQCSDTGLTWELDDDCPQGLACDPLTTNCDPLICEPDQPACNENLVTTCDATGFGYTGAETDCGSESCWQGECYDCTAIGLTDALRLVRFEDGLVTLQNRSGCDMALDDVNFEIVTYEVSLEKYTTVLPSFTLNAGETVTLGDGDILVNTAPIFAFDSGFEPYVALCDGVCDETSMFDAVAIEGGPSLPPPLEFTGFIDINFESGEILVRSAYAGVSPTFLASDWSVVVP